MMSVIAIPKAKRDVLGDEGSEALVEIFDMEAKMSQMEARIIKWMFIFWIGQIGVLTAIFGVIFKK